MAPPKVKLTYFNARGRAEVSRIMFKIADVDFEDHRIEGTWKDQDKPKSLWGAIPELDVNGKRHCQSHAIERYIAKKNGFYGKDDEEQFDCDMIVDCFEDVFMAMFKSTQGSDAEKAEKRKELIEEKLPYMFTKLEGFIKSSGFFVNDKIMWADVQAAHVLTYLDVMKLDVDLKKFPKLLNIKNKVESHPKVAEWIKKRPVTSF